MSGASEQELRDELCSLACWCGSRCPLECVCKIENHPASVGDSLVDATIANLPPPPQQSAKAWATTTALALHGLLTRVEVCFDDPGFLGSWYEAVVLGIVWKGGLWLRVRCFLLPSPQR